MCETDFCLNVIGYGFGMYKKLLSKPFLIFSFRFQVLILFFQFHFSFVLVNFFRFGQFYSFRFRFSFLIHILICNFVDKTSFFFDFLNTLIFFSSYYGFGYASLLISLFFNFLRFPFLNKLCCGPFYGFRFG